jgi:hypothetical protein
LEDAFTSQLRESMHIILGNQSKAEDKTAKYDRIRILRDVRREGLAKACDCTALP